MKRVKCIDCGTIAAIRNYYEAGWEFLESDIETISRCPKCKDLKHTKESKESKEPKEQKNENL